MTWRRFVDVRRLILAVPLLAAIAIGGWWLTGRGADQATPRAVLARTPGAAGMPVGVQKGELARDFIGHAPDGTAVHLSDLRGRPTIINFWATWCASCALELPDLKAVQRSIGPGRLNVVAVNAGEDNGAATSFLRTLDANAFRVAMDPTLVVADAYGVFGLPRSVFVDSSGVVRAIYTGQLSQELMRQYVAAASAGDTAPDAPPKVRLITTVARDHVLQVHAMASDAVEFRSKSLRCDDTYCSGAALDALAASGGVISIDRFLSEDPPRIVVRFNAAATRADTVSQSLAAQLNVHADPLYERPLTVERS